MAKLKLSEDLRPLSDLEADASQVVQQALQTSSDRQEIQRDMNAAEQDIADGNWIENSEILVKLKRWSAGEPS
jgi:predicted transcriptional regulator